MQYRHFVRALMLRNLYLGATKRLGESVKQLNIPPRVFDEPLALIPASEVDLWFSQLIELAADPDLMIRVAPSIDLDRQGPIGRWFFSGYDLSATIRRVNSGITCLQSGAIWAGEQSGTIMKWTYQNHAITSHNKRHDAVRSAVFMTKVLRRYLGESYAPTRVVLPGNSAHPERYHAFFNCDIGWNHHRAEVWFTDVARHTERHIAVKERASLAMNFSDLDDLLNMPSPEDEIKVVYETVNYARHFGLPTVEKTAQLLGLSDQQFTRRLRGLGLSFTVISGYVLSIKAVNLFNQGWDIASVANNLGYTNIASFKRMFKKNRGVTPSQYLHLFHAGR